MFTVEMERSRRLQKSTWVVESKGCAESLGGRSEGKEMGALTDGEN